MVDELLLDARFLEFVSRRFDRIAAHSTLEEMAAFAFGSVEEAQEAFDQNHAER